MLKIFSKLFHRGEKPSHPYCSAIVAAAGTSSRMGENKLLMPLDGIPVLARTLQNLDGAELIDEIAGRYGRQFIVVTIDARMDETGRWVVTTHGGRQPSERELFSWAREAQERGAGEILFTSMNHDGTKSGYPCETFARLASELSIPVIASGGAGTVDHIAEVLMAGRADAALAASIFHYGEIPIPVLKRALNERKIPVRI